MKSIDNIFYKLQKFIHIYYINELIKGLIFFIGFGILYFLFTIFIEYLFWLKPLSRSILFYLFIFIEFFLLTRYILFPFFKLFKLKKGIDFKIASTIIGNHFPNISDKLINLLQLSFDLNHSELLSASIEQKSNSLKFIPFNNAVNFYKNKIFLPLAVIPLVMLLLVYFSSFNNILLSSFNRLTHYKNEFIPPAPFHFEILNKNLITEQNQDFILKVKSVGIIIPDKVLIFIDNSYYYMIKNNNSEFQYVVNKPNKNLLFHFKANLVQSSNYQLEVIKIPTIAKFTMELNFPSYLKKKSEVINNSGNAIIPEGTEITWIMNAQATEHIDWKSDNLRESFNKQKESFNLTKSFFKNTEYEIITSNFSIKNYEKLNYKISVINDQYPTIICKNIPDSLKIDNNFIIGQISDDYGLTKLQVVYYQKDNLSTIKRQTIPIKSDIYDQFIFTNSKILNFQKGLIYEYYFEVFDNDKLHNFKSTKSDIYTNRVITNTESETQQLNQQNQNIKNLSQSLKNQIKQSTLLDKIQNIYKEKNILEFNEQKRIDNYIVNQIRQEDIMNESARNIKENLLKAKPNEPNVFKNELLERIEDIQQNFEKTKALLKELKEYNDKIKQNELKEKINILKQNSKVQHKSLEQLIELTKKFYFEQMTEQIKQKLDSLSVKQEELSNIDKENEIDKQKEINNEFDKITKEIKKLEIDSKGLKKPINIDFDKEQGSQIDKDLNNALDKLQQNQKKSAKSNQKSASKGMKQMAQKLEESINTSESEELDEDIEMLRQVLDNLLSFSFSQEELMRQFKKTKFQSPSFNKSLKLQQNLKQEFISVDDSLFALALRNPKLSNETLIQVEDVHYNLNKSIDNLIDSQIIKGTSYQQYTTNAANKLSNFLSELLNSLQQSKQSSLSGKSKSSQNGEMQLPDIIKKQGDLQDKIISMNKNKSNNKNGSQIQNDDDNNIDSKDINQQDKFNNHESSSQTKKKNQTSENIRNNKMSDDEYAKNILQILKEQQSLREQVQNKIKILHNKDYGVSVIQTMKDIEKQLLNNGFVSNIKQKSSDIKQDLLKLDIAIREEGQNEKRQSNSNQKKYFNNLPALPQNLQDYLNEIEILNRQFLPLKTDFKDKVKIYFQNND